MQPAQDIAVALQGLVAPALRGLGVQEEPDQPPRTRPPLRETRGLHVEALQDLAGRREDPPRLAGRNDLADSLAQLLQEELLVDNRHAFLILLYLGPPLAQQSAHIIAATAASTSATIILCPSWPSQ